MEEYLESINEEKCYKNSLIKKIRLGTAVGGLNTGRRANGIFFFSKGTVAQLRNLFTLFIFLL